MPLFAILQYRAFPWYEFQTGVPDKSWLAAAGDVVSVRDVAQDLMHNIKPAYQEYTLNSQQTGVINQQGTYVGQKKKKYKTRTFIIGNLGAQEAKRRKGGGTGVRSEKKESRRNRSIQNQDLRKPLTDISVVELDRPRNEILNGDTHYKPDNEDNIESDGEGVEESRADSIGHEAPDESLETLGLGIETLPTEFPPEDNTV
uniref:Uncharacterized protein n=2 Tax=Lotharella globosa TaxID=91324 RepID=A0A7S3Z5A7_9EUKA